MSIRSCSALDDMIEMVRAICPLRCSFDALTCGVVGPAVQLSMNLGVALVCDKHYTFTKHHQNGAKVASNSRQKSLWDQHSRPASSHHNARLHFTWLKLALNTRL